MPPSATGWGAEMEARTTVVSSERRLLRFLAPGPASLRPASVAGRLLVEASGRGAVAVEEHVLAALAASGAIRREGFSVTLTAGGAAPVQNPAAPADAFGGRQRELGVVTADTGAGPVAVMANLSESPLAQLVRRKAKDGKPFLAPLEFEAGERLRADYTRGQIMPRLGANWEASVSSGRRADGIADLTDVALAARHRVEAALLAVGPELSGVLVDVCCFLKGLERVESERGWSLRSAKIVLKTGLAALARHYRPPARGPRHALHWGAQDYRPRIA